MSVASLDSGPSSTPPSRSIALAGSRNETLGFAFQLDAAGADRGAMLRVATFTRDERPADRLPAAGVEWGQVLPMPLDLNRAGYLRQSGLASASVRSLPRAIVPLTARAGAVPVSALRPGMASPVIWLDLPIGLDAVPGTYSGAVELVAADGQTVSARLPIRLVVYDLALPARRSLDMLGQVRWDDLSRGFDQFEAITPNLINRSDARYRPSVATLDAIVGLAQRHRLTLAIDRLQPTAKWNPTATVDWRDFDSLVGPWLDGNAFSDKEGLGLWPLPSVGFLFNYPAAAQRDYYASAAAHFDAKEWLGRAPVWIDAIDATSGDARRRTLERAAAVLNAHPRIRVAVPMEAEQLQFAAADAPTLPARGDDDRLITAGPGLIFNTPIQANAPRRAATFLRTDSSGPIPVAGTGGDERDVRVWAWLAYVRGASIVRFEHTLPAADRPDVPADPNELVWFYPGKWFGVDGPVPSLQLKWLRRAEQDFEYLALADARGQRINARLMARLLTKPVQIQPAQAADPVYALMAGTTDQAAWDEGMRILTKTILLRPPGQQSVDPQAQTTLNLETLQWAEPQEKPLVLGRSTLFAPDGKGGVDVRIGLDVYNASDTTPTNNTLGFEQVPRGWTVDPQPQLIPPLATYQVQRFGLKANIDPDAVTARSRSLLGVTFTNGYTRRAMPAPLVLPAAVTRRREGNLAINGSLEDWTDDDALCLGPLVRMLDRPTLQQHTLADAPTRSDVYSAWSEANFYVAFKVGGLTQTPLQSAQNFVRYDFRRAWGEDVVQVLVQAVYADGTLGPVLHVAVKPNGVQWTDRKLDLRETADEKTWEALQLDARYACTLDKGDWRGELAIPWRALQPPGFVEGPDRLPVMLRFNFSQHQHATGTSASWAGPIDHGRDDTFTGVLVLRNLEGR